VTQFRQNDHHRDNGKILNDEHPDHDAAGKRAHPPLAHQGFQDDHRTRERNQCPEPESGLPVQSPPGAQGKSESLRQDNLQGRPDEGDFTDGFQFLQREFQSQGKQQEGNADLGKLFDIVDAGCGNAAGMRTDDDAGLDVAQDQGLPEEFGQQSAGQRGDDYDNDVRRYAHCLCFPSRR
jgi:hypothetical protein